MISEIEFRDNFGKSLSEIRKKKNITQQQLAESINYSDKSVSKWERGESTPDLYTIYTICDKLEITPNHLLGVESKDVNAEYINKNVVREKKEKIISIFVPAITAVSILFICCILYFILKSIPSKATIAPSTFSLIIPVMFIVLLVLSFAFWKSKAQFICLSGLIWSVGWTVHVLFLNQFTSSVDLYILISCFLLQVITILVFAFIHMLRKTSEA